MTFYLVTFLPWLITLRSVFTGWSPRHSQVNKASGLSVSQLEVMVSMRPHSYYTPQIEISNGGKRRKVADEIIHIDISIQQKTGA